MGSPDFALPSLQALAHNFNVVGVVTQPDRPSGRGRKPVAPPVKKLALNFDISTIQPEKLSQDLVAKEQVAAWEPDVIVVAAFGQILKKDVLELAPFGCINVHASLLPKWRGVSPIQAAIINGDEKTGVTIMKMDEGIDTGDILSQKEVPITPEDTGGSLFKKLAKLGADLLVVTLDDYFNDRIDPRPQGESPTPYAPMLKKTDGELDFSKPAEVLERQIRAYNPWPGTYTYWMGNLLKVHKANVLYSKSIGPGKRTIHEGYPVIGTADGSLVLEEVQPSGKRSMSGEAYLLGARSWES